ncbi:hypothetical protein AKJ16_DCAP21351 [Drosera capensis]
MYIVPFPRLCPTPFPFFFSPPPPIVSARLNFSPTFHSSPRSSFSFLSSFSFNLLQRSRGTVRWFNESKGYSFIKPNFGGFRTLSENDVVDFVVDDNNSKLKALDGAPISSKKKMAWWRQRRRLWLADDCLGCAGSRPCGRSVAEPFSMAVVSADISSTGTHRLFDSAHTNSGSDTKYWF